MVHLKIFTIITAVFMATVGYGQSYGKEETVMGSDNIASVVKSSLNAIPNLRVGSVTGNFVYKAIFIFRKDENTGAYNYAAFGKLSIDDVTITMSDGEMVTFKPEGRQEGIVFKTYHKLFVQSGYNSGYELSIPVSIDGTSSVDGKNSSFTNQFVTSTTDKEISTGSFEHSLGGKYININCTGLTQQTIKNIKSEIERVRERYDQLKKSQQDRQNYQNSGNNSSSSSSLTLASEGNSSSSGSSNSSSNNTTNSNTSSSSKKTSDDKTETNTNSNVPKATYTDPRTGTELTYEQLEYQRQQYQHRERERIANAVNPGGQIMKESGLNDYFQREMDRIDREYEEKSAALDRELARQKREKEAKALQEKQEWEAIMAKREKYESITKNVYEIYNRYPSGELPTSATKVNTNKLYYFIYAGTIGSYTGNEIFNGEAIEYVSNVFAIGQYPDGTWPMKTTIESEVRTLTNGRGVIHGYFTSEKEAQIALDRFKSEIINAGMKINNITYEGKNAKIQQNQTDNSQQALDYWGNPIKNTNTTQPQKTQPKQQEKKKPKLDYWGNPIKE